MGINYYLEKLLLFAIKKELLDQNDYFFARNFLMSLLKTETIYDKKIEITDSETIQEILTPIIDYALENKIIKDASINNIDEFDAKIMGGIISRPNEVINKFNYLTKTINILAATDWYYKFSINSHYIKNERISKNISWNTLTNIGNLEITINLSKPEKSPQEIAAAKNFKSTGYPKCILCAENEGYQGDAQLPARQNHRIIPLFLSNEKWYLQYSPYVYFNEHCIVLSAEHRPMKIEKQTFERLLEFVEQFPHYFIGSNADLPIVGGSILSHDHFQGGKHNFPMAGAKSICNFFIQDIEIEIVNWHMSVLRIKSADKNKLINFSNFVFSEWKNYSNKELNIQAYTYDIQHNTITPIARFRNNKFELDLVLRNNKTTKQYPDGIFHPHQNLHHIKKENIGLIEVMGLAILPGRLLTELKIIEENIQSKNTIQEICSKNPEIEKHAKWISFLRQKYSNIELHKTKDLLKYEVGIKFKQVLEDAAVFKKDEHSKNEFHKFTTNLIKNYDYQ
ncbi:MAG: UDP-glucose--hexose-1-phosphate uridylyltransferase [Bacteroidales bacterium]|nr:UDP-glucose--hexose-1-phosphate uridylyltransferase [Bacteroidales bacterium]